jgi:hypothetical protein
MANPLQMDVMMRMPCNDDAVCSATVPSLLKQSLAGKSGENRPIRGPWRKPGRNPPREECDSDWSSLLNSIVCEKFIQPIYHFFLDKKSYNYQKLIKNIVTKIAFSSKTVIFFPGPRGCS